MKIPQLKLETFLFVFFALHFQYGELLRKESLKLYLLFELLLSGWKERRGFNEEAKKRDAEIAQPTSL